MFIEIPPSSETTKGFRVYQTMLKLDDTNCLQLGLVPIQSQLPVELHIFHIDYPSKDEKHNSRWVDFFESGKGVSEFLRNIRNTFFPEKKGSPRNYFIQQNLLTPNLGIIIGHGEIYSEIDNRLVGGLGDNAASFDYEDYLINSIISKYPNLTSLVIAICAPDDEIDTRDYTKIQNTTYPIFFARNLVPFFGKVLNPNGSVVVLQNGETKQYFFDKYDG